MTAMRWDVPNSRFPSGMTERKATENARFKPTTKTGLEWATPGESASGILSIQDCGKFGGQAVKAETVSVLNRFYVGIMGSSGNRVVCRASFMTASTSSKTSSALMAYISRPLS